MITVRRLRRAYWRGHNRGSRGEKPWFNIDEAPDYGSEVERAIEFRGQEIGYEQFKRNWRAAHVEAHGETPVPEVKLDPA